MHMTTTDLAPGRGDAASGNWLTACARGCSSGTRQTGMKRAAFVALVAAGIAGTRGTAAARQQLVTYRDTGCGCCEGWVNAARDRGYAVALHDIERKARLSRFRLTEASAGCHTTLAQGYVIEGHVPLDVVARLLSERPRIRGITLPGMPLGVPGMVGGRTGKLTVLTLDAEPRVYATV